MLEAKGEARRHLARLLATRPPRAKSLVVTVFGDSILPHGGTVWVGSLIRLLGPFGINERGVRTAVQRLTVEGWLSSRSVGRRAGSVHISTSGSRRARRNTCSPPARPRADGCRWRCAPTAAVSTDSER